MTILVFEGGARANSVGPRRQISCLKTARAPVFQFRRHLFSLPTKFSFFNCMQGIIVIDLCYIITTPAAGVGGMGPRKLFTYSNHAPRASLT